MDDPTYDQFAGFTREFWQVPPRKAITPDTQFERDLGLTGDDGDELLLATQRRFGIQLGSEETGIREIFNLGPNEYLFQFGRMGTVSIPSYDCSEEETSTPSASSPLENCSKPF